MKNLERAIPKTPTPKLDRVNKPTQYALPTRATTSTPNPLIQSGKLERVNRLPASVPKPTPNLERVRPNLERTSNVPLERASNVSLERAPTERASRVSSNISAGNKTNLESQKLERISIPTASKEIVRETVPEIKPSTGGSYENSISEIFGETKSSSITTVSVGSYANSMDSIFCEDVAASNSLTAPESSQPTASSKSLKSVGIMHASETLFDSVSIIQKSIQDWIKKGQGEEKTFEQEAYDAFVAKYQSVQDEWNIFVQEIADKMKHIDTKFKAVKYLDVKRTIEATLVNILTSYILIGKDTVAGDGIDNTEQVSKRNYLGTHISRTDYYYVNQLHPTQDDILKADGLSEHWLKSELKDVKKMREAYPSVMMRTEEFLQKLMQNMTDLHCLKYQLREQDEKHQNLLKMKDELSAHVVSLTKTIRIQESDIEDATDDDVRNALIENQKDRLEQKKKLSQEIRILDEKIKEVIRIKDGTPRDADQTQPKDIGLYKKIDIAINTIFEPIHFECVMHEHWPTNLEFEIFSNLAIDDYKAYKRHISVFSDSVTD